MRKHRKNVRNIFCNQSKTNLKIIFTFIIIWHFLRTLHYKTFKRNGLFTAVTNQQKRENFNVFEIKTYELNYAFIENTVGWRYCLPLHTQLTYKSHEIVEELYFVHHFYLYNF